MKKIDIGAFDAKTHFSTLLEKVQHGQIYRITKRGKPVAELHPYIVKEARAVYGSEKGKIKISDDFDAPLPEFDSYMP